MSKSKQISLEEYFDNEGTGVELEESPVSTRQEPWNPDQIRIATKPFSLRQILDMLTDGELDLAPDFQRFRLWKPAQKSRLIESILLGIPLPSFYFSEQKDLKMQVVDGVQRLSSILEFSRGEGSKGFALSDLEYLKSLEGKRFNELDGVWKRRFNGTQIFVHVIDPQTPYLVVFDIFKRLNTGGSPLNAQEIRHCIGGPTSRDLLKRAVAQQAFHDATGSALKNHIRMVDRELALRFFAFRHPHNVEQYREAESLDDFLTVAMRAMDELAEKERQRFLVDFDTAMKNAKLLFGDHAFRKWPLGDEQRHPINRALFESWAVALSDVSWKDLAPRKDEIVDTVRRLMTEDPAYISSISGATADWQKVESRFSRARSLLAGSSQ